MAKRTIPSPKSQVLKIYIGSNRVEIIASLKNFPLTVKVLELSNFANFNHSYKQRGSIPAQTFL